MYEKLGETARRRCTDSWMCNELLVVPESASDVGQDEYFTLKAETYWRKASLKVPFERSVLSLSFPGPDDSPFKVAEFFDSPRAFMHNMPFRGCFAIDVSAYRDAKARASIHFRALKSFIAASKDIVFLLLLRTDRRTEAVDFIRSLDDEAQFSLVSLEGPSRERLMEYTRGVLGEDFRYVDLSPLFNQRSDFRAADRFIGYVRASEGKDPINSISTYLNTFRLQDCRKEIGY